MKIMFKRIPVRKSGINLPDLFAFALVMAGFLACLAVGRYWSGPMMPPPAIDLKFRSLPYALFLSTSRIILAYIVCLISSLAVGYWAAHSRTAEKIIIPLIDIGQCVPVLAFLPGLNLTLIMLFPESRIGLEIAAVLTLYTGMAWNLMLAFYASIKTIPREYVETIRAYGYGPLGVLFRLELPYSMNAIVWNSMLSVAGGWFFLTVCESYTLGKDSYNLVGLGSYMNLASEKGDYFALVSGGLAMVLILVFTDYVIWNPLLRWAERFQRIGGAGDEEEDEPVINFFAKSKRITSFLRKIRRRYAAQLYVYQRRGRRRREARVDWNTAGYLLLAVLTAFSAWGIYLAVQAFAGISQHEWAEILVASAWTLARVVTVVVLSGAIMVPVGLWLAMQPQLVKRLQPVIQVAAAFPWPMVFGILMLWMITLHVPIFIASVVLMMTGSMWYLLFNVISGAASVPQPLVEVAQTTGMAKFEIIRRVYLPATFSQILTGLITAAGGAWNVSIVAELVLFRGQEYSVKGLGAYITKATARAAYSELAAAVMVMIVLIVLLNRTFWAKLYDLAESKYRLDG
jgi:NitT/TauT family transport system permease protein